jgi:crotonobetainyl-CoA:carnitine CoA-transferase CaiB-like acyl-CoA transferase
MCQVGDTHGAADKEPFLKRPKSGPLEGIRVLDLTMFWAGPAMTELLGSMGAEVIKVEAVKAPDPSRKGGARLIMTPDETRPPHEISPQYNATNRNKYGLTLDLTKPEGQDVFKRLVAISDVVAENYTPRVMPKFGLDYATLRDIRPALVMISMPGFGSTGPWRDFRSFAFSTEQATGFPQITGYGPDRPPSRWGPAGADAFAGLTGAFAVLAALEYRRRTGQGQHIDLSQVESITTWRGQEMIDYSWNHRNWSRLGNRHRLMAPHGVYRAAGDDRWIAIAVENDEQWQSLCRHLGRADWAQRNDLAYLEGRFAAHDELDQGIETWTTGREQREAARLLQQAGVAAGPVLGGADLLGDPQLNARGFVDWLDREWIGKAPYNGMFAKFSATPGSFRLPAPLLGEHNEKILKGLLSLKDEEYAQLEAEGVIGNVVPTLA